MELTINRAQALDLLCKYNKEPFHILHGLTPTRKKKTKYFLYHAHYVTFQCAPGVLDSSAYILDAMWPMGCP